MNTKKTSLLQNEIRARIEVALYCSGKPMSIDDLVRAAGITSREKTVQIVNDIMKTVNSEFKAIEVAKLEDGTFVLQVKSTYLSIVRRFSNQPVLSQGSLKTLSYIAYEQPVSSRRLVHIRGSQVYSHLKELDHQGFVKRESVGRSKLYKTSEKFRSYFGIPDLNLMKSRLIASGKS